MVPKPKRKPKLIPQIIIDIADTYFDESLLNKDVPTKNDYYHRFSDGLWTALVTPKYYRYSGNPAREKGYAVGQKYLQEYPENISEIVSAYGWKPVETKGVWVREFEISGFLPDGIVVSTLNAFRQAEPWWLDNMSDFDPDASKFNYNLERLKGLYVHVRGFLSQEGNYGHLGEYTHLFYASFIELI